MRAAREPLIAQSSGSKRSPWSALAKTCIIPSFTLAYVLTGSIERVFFSRMAARMRCQVLLMHTALAALNSMLFMVLRLARSQSSRSAVSAKLQALRPGELLLMAVLDAMHSLLALDGATRIMGTMQAMLVQGVVPASMAFTPLLPADPLLWLPYSRTQLVAAVAVALFICALLLPLPASLMYDADTSNAEEGELQASWVARFTFASSSLFAALSTVYKRQRLTRAPLDPLLLNSWLGATQLCAGLVLGPPLMLLLHQACHATASAAACPPARPPARAVGPPPPRLRAHTAGPAAADARVRLAARAAARRAAPLPAR
jgi:hypothetical protein